VKKLSLVILGVVVTLLFALDVSEFNVDVGKNNIELDTKVIDALERQAYDARVRFTGSLKQDSRIVVIDIDEDSIAKIGQWPWPREVMAKLTNNLFDLYKVDTLGFDIVFAEAETDFTKNQVTQAYQDTLNGGSNSFEQALESFSGDKQFADALQNRSVVMGYSFDSEDSLNIGELPNYIFSTSDYDDKNIYNETSAPVAKRYTANIPLLQQTAQKAGYFSLDGLIDPDGIIRRAGLLNRYDSKLYPSLSLQLALTYLRKEAKPIVVKDDSGIEGLEAIELLHRNIALDSEGAAFVPYSMSLNTYKYIPSSKVPPILFSEVMRDLDMVVSDTVISASLICSH